MPKLPTIHRHRVNSPRNSICGSAILADLDWTNWFTDTTGGGLYLHVRSLDEEAWYPVYCRQTAAARLLMQDGVLYWLVDEEAGKCPSA